MRITRTRLTICSTGRCTKHYAVYFEKRASWVKPTAANFGVGLIPDLLQGGEGYEQILTLGFIYQHKEGTTRTNVFLLLSHKV